MYNYPFLKYYICIRINFYHTIFVRLLFYLFYETRLRETWLSDILPPVFTNRGNSIDIFHVLFHNKMLRIFTSMSVTNK